MTQLEQDIIKKMAAMLTLVEYGEYAGEIESLVLDAMCTNIATSLKELLHSYAELNGIEIE